MKANALLGPFVILSICLTAGRTAAGDRLTLRAVFDGRVVAAPDSPGFLEGGLGKTRYGGTGRKVEATVSHVALLGRFEFRPDLGLDTHFRLDAEHDFGRRLDPVEAFLRFTPALGDSATLVVRAGLFFPTLSLENTDPAWLSPYTLSFSAINAWIGEEVRTLGLEAGPSWRIGETQARAFATLARANDPAGTLLAWRGFALHDRVSGASDRLPLPPLKSFTRPDLFPDQALYVQPTLEVDSRWTWSSGVAVDHALYRARVHYQPPTAGPTAFDGRQYAWRTSFWSVGVARQVGPIEVMTQGISGQTRMGLTPQNQTAVIATFRSAFLLASWSPAGSRQRFSLRYDISEVRDDDNFTRLDPNDESGDAWTIAYSIVAGKRSRFTAEVLHLDTTRSNRADLGRSERERETQGSLSWRLTF